MKNEFVSYEMALELKELGFDESCFAAYYGKSDISNFKESDYVLCGDRHNTSFQKDGRVSAPLHQQVFRWFREKHNLHSNIKCVNTTYNNHFRFEIESNGETLVCKNRIDSYKEAELACLLKLIENETK